MNDFFKDKYVKDLEEYINILERQKDIAIIGLEVIISEGSDNLHIAEKTLEEIKECDSKSQE